MRTELHDVVSSLVSAIARLTTHVALINPGADMSVIVSDITEAMELAMEYDKRVSTNTESDDVKG